MHHNYSSYNTFEVDISDNVYYEKENVIAIYVNTEEFEGWWYQGGGIYRDVHLTITEPVCIDLWGVYAPYKKLNDTDWQIDYETTVLNTDYENCAVTVESSLIDKDGNTVAVANGEGSISKRNKTNITYFATVKNPLLWDCDNPNLYTVKTVLKMNGEIIDENTIRIGFRTIEITVDKGLLLNGKKTFINGVCAHQDFGLTGLAVTENIAKYNIPVVVCINHFAIDTDDEVNALIAWCKEHGYEYSFSDGYLQGGAGSIDLAEKVYKTLNEKESHYAPLYDEKLSIKEKIETICKEIYGAKDVVYLEKAEQDILEINELGYDKTPVCIAKTPQSLSDNAKLLGVPVDFTVTIREVRLSAGAGFVVPLAGKVMTMPGLPKVPAAVLMETKK
jgi:hypothetical protein